MKKKPTRILHAALTSVMLMAGASLQAQTVSVTYIGPTGLDNYWTVGSNWTGGVAPNNGQPTAETIYNATINNGNTVSVLYYTPITINNLTLGNAGIAGGGVMVNGQLTLGNAASVGNSQLATKTGITFGENITLNGNWLRNGTGAESAGANWDSGTLTFNNSTATNSANSTWNAKGGLYDSVSSGNVFSNEGTFIKSTVSTLTIEPTFNSNLGSTASVSEGELRLLGGGTHNGALNVSDAATLTLGGTHTISGSLSVSSLAAFNVSSGTTTVNVPYNHSGASAISNGAALTFNGTGTHTGSFSNSGTLNFGGAARTITAAAEFTGSGAINFQSGTTTIHSASRSFDGPVSFQGGTASIGAGSTFSGVGAVNFSGATVTTGSTFSISNPLTISAGQWNNTGTVTATGSLSVTGGVMSDSGTVTVSGVTTFTGGTISGSGTLNANGGITISGTNTKTLAGGHIVNAGSHSTWSAGQIDAGGGAVFNNNGSFTTNFDGTVSLHGGDVRFNNAGTFTKSGGVGATTFGNGGYGPTVFNNTGTVEVNSGMLALNGNGTHTNSLFSIATGATLSLGGAHSFSSASTSTINGAGLAVVAGTTSVNGNGTVNVSAPLSLAGTLNGTGTVNSTTSTHWTTGTLTGAGTLNVSGVMTMDGTGTKTLEGGRVINSTANTTWSEGLINAGGGAVFNNNGSFSTNFDGTLSLHGGDVRFNNAGTFTKSGGPGATTFGNGGYGPTVFNNTGTVEVNSGTLALNGTVTQHSGSTLTGGTWNVTNGASISIATGSNITTNGAASTVMLDGAGSSFNRLTTALNNNQGSFTLKNNRDLTTAGAYANSGTTRVEDSTTVFTVNGAYTQTGGVTAMVGGAFIDPSVFNLNGGTLQGTGTIESSVIAGPGSNTIEPGMSPGTLTINGNLTLSSGSTLAMELGGLTQGSLYDFLDVNGVLTLAGLLDLDFINDFQNSLTSGEILTLATANSAILGSFSNVASGGYLMTNYPIALQVWYGAGSPFGAENLVVAIPEPSRAMLIMLGGLALLQRRRRAAFTTSHA